MELMFGVWEYNNPEICNTFLNFKQEVAQHKNNIYLKIN